MLRMTAVICSLLVAGTALAADPCSDPMCADEGFGASGRVAIDFAYGDADRGNAVVRVPGQDRLYVIGQVSTAVAGDDDFGVACLLDDGSPCPTLNKHGIVQRQNDTMLRFAPIVFPTALGHDLGQVAQKERENAQ